MKMHTIEKQKLLSEPLSKYALKLAKALYHTYLKDDKNLCMEFPTKAVLGLFKLSYSKTSILFIQSIFEELNEPILVKNFKIFGKVYDMKFIRFCTYKIDNNKIEVELNPEYLLAESEYMQERFLV